MHEKNDTMHVSVGYMWNVCVSRAMRIENPAVAGPKTDFLLDAKPSAASLCFSNKYLDPVFSAC